MPPSPEDKRIYNHVKEILGSKVNVFTHCDDDGKRRLDVLRCDDTPANGVTSYSTIGLSTQLKQWETRDDFPFGVELCGACYSEIEEFSNVLVTVAYCAMRNAWELEPDIVHPGIIQEYALSKTMKHVFLVVPFLWEPDFGKLHHGDSMSLWLQVVPISDAEHRHQQDFGSDSLKKQLECNEVNTFDICRPCIFS